jgi:hypothetical protein
VRPRGRWLRRALRGPRLQVDRRRRGAHRAHRGELPRAPAPPARRPLPACPPARPDAGARATLPWSTCSPGPGPAAHRACWASPSTGDCGSPAGPSEVARASPREAHGAMASSLAPAGRGVTCATVLGDSATREAHRLVELGPHARSSEGAIRRRFRARAPACGSRATRSPSTSSGRRPARSSDQTACGRSSTGSGPPRSARTPSPGAPSTPSPGRERRAGRPRGTRSAAAGWATSTGPSTGSASSPSAGVPRCRPPRARPSGPSPRGPSGAASRSWAPSPPGAWSCDAPGSVGGA